MKRRLKDYTTSLTVRPPPSSTCVLECNLQMDGKLGPMWSLSKRKRAKKLSMVKSPTLMRMAMHTATTTITPNQLLLKSHQK